MEMKTLQWKKLEHRERNKLWTLCSDTNPPHGAFAGDSVSQVAGLTAAVPFPWISHGAACVGMTAAIFLE